MSRENSMDSWDDLTHPHTFNIRSYRLHAIRAAKDLFYGEKVIEKIKNAKTQSEICRIMATERKRRR